MAIGPALGSVLRRATGTPLSVFYFSAICHILFSLVNWTVVPESLSIQRREEARQQRTGNRPRSPGLKGMGAHGIRALLSFAEPLAVMLPVRRKGPRRGKKIGRYDWSLTLVGFSHMFSLMVLVCTLQTLDSFPILIILIRFRVLTPTFYNMHKLHIAGRQKRYGLFLHHITMLAYAFS